MLTRDIAMRLTENYIMYLWTKYDNIQDVRKALDSFIDNIGGRSEATTRLGNAVRRTV